MIEILIGVVIILLVVIFYLYKNIKTYVKIVDDLSQSSNDKNIQLATLKQKLSNLKDILNKTDDQLQDTKKINIRYNEEIKDSKIKIAQLQTQLSEQNRSIKEKLELLEQNKKKLKLEFENLATKIFDNNSKKFKEQNKESVSNLLNPVKQQLSEFKKKVEDIYDKEAKDRSILGAELKMLKDLNLKMASEATNLANALRYDNKTQGGWGEMVLDKALESSGLREGYEFVKQKSLKDNNNISFKPDVIVHLPDNRHIIIDAKTSLVAYNEYVSQTNKELKQKYLKEHIKSIKEHIKGLSNKKYEDLQNINSLDFIFMFLPIEGALLVALNNDVNLFEEAFKQKIILVSPSTLLIALKTVENVWRYERQAQNIRDVYRRAEELYKKFTNFVDDLKKVDKGIETARESYDEAFKKLSTGRGNLVSQVVMLQKVSNIKPKKELENSLVDTALIDNV